MKERFPDAQNFELRKNRSAQGGETQTADDQGVDIGRALSPEFFLSISQFDIGRSVFKAQESYGEKSLSECDEQLVKMRAELLLKLNMVFYKMFKLVDHDKHHLEESNHGKHFALKHLILPTLLFKLVKDELSQVDAYEAEAF